MSPLKPIGAHYNWLRVIDLWSHRNPKNFPSSKEANSVFIFSPVVSVLVAQAKKWRRLMKHHQETPRPVRRSSGPSVLSVTPSTKALVTNKVTHNPSLILKILFLWRIFVFFAEFISPSFSHRFRTDLFSRVNQ